MTTPPPLPDDLSLSLVSHTNVGKTTLARTLLGRDIGEVLDQAHVTETAEPHVLAQAAGGERLLLWDTPGFGDSQRLARRLAQAGNPLGWLLTEVWDRWRDRAFWASQRAVRHVLDQTDVALYLVNASEAPEDAAYLAPELQVLALVGKPVIVLLNQLGDPTAPADEAREVQRWQDHLDSLVPPGADATSPAVVRAVLPLDAFSRCWVQEAVLLQAVAAALPVARQPLMARLATVWRDGRQATFAQAMDLLAARLQRAALDRESASGSPWSAPLRQAGQTLGRWLGRGQGDVQMGGPDTPQDPAAAALAQRLDADIRRSTDALVRLHQLEPETTDQVLHQLARHFARRQPLHEGRAALWGGLVSGALAGLKADIASGGLTLGGGLLAGGVLGALAGAGAARGVNRVRGTDRAWLTWDEPVLDALLRASLLGYLAVAHHGRGRGAWRQAEPPPAWGPAVDAVLARHQAERSALWLQRGRLLASPASPALPASPASLASLASPASLAPSSDPALDVATQALLRTLGADLLQTLYPDAAVLAGFSPRR